MKGEQVQGGPLGSRSRGRDPKPRVEGTEVLGLAVPGGRPHDGPRATSDPHGPSLRARLCVWGFKVYETVTEVLHPMEGGVEQ